MFHPKEYQLASLLFIRLMGLIYLCVFGAFLFQIKGLLGERGILPIKRYLEAVQQRFPKSCYYYLPSLFWLRNDNKALVALTSMGVACSLLLTLGILPPLMLLLLYLLWLSIVSVGQDFLSFGWDVFILEITANAFFLSLTPVPNLFIWISINLLLFRFHIQAGAVKFQSRDPNWKNWTALSYHYLTQPLPNTIAWFIHKFPLWFHKISAIEMFAIELVIPFAIFGTEEMRLIAFIAFVGLQYAIWQTGNFAYLNHLTAIFCIILLSNRYLIPLMGAPAESAPPALWLNYLLSFVGIVLITIQLMQLCVHFFKNSPALFHKILQWLSPFHIVNRYGIFAVMTTQRIEIVIEGSQDGIFWQEYLFKYKPSEVFRRPRRISPYQPRLDWQLWFLPFSSFQSNPWFHQLLYQLLLGSRDVTDLMRFNPFPVPPRYIRALAYDYEFTTKEERAKNGHWWKRRLIGPYSPTISLKPLIAP